MRFLSLFRKKSHQTAIWILLSAAAVQTYNYFFLVSQPYLLKRLDLHTQILNGTAPSPYLYRDLIPFLAEILFRVCHPFFSSELAFSITYVLLDFAGISLVLISLYFLLTQWFTWEFSLTGGLFCAAVIGITAHEHYFQPWSFWEAGFFTLSLLLILHKKMLWLGVLVASASLNRETGLLIPLIFLAITQDIKGILLGKARLELKSIAYFFALTLVWALIFFGLRLLRGDAAHVETLQQILESNLNPENLWKAALNILLFQGAFWVFAILGYRTAPEFIRRTIWIIPPYILLMAIWSYWLEVRVLMPLYAVIIPLAVSYINEKVSGSNQTPC